MDSPAGAGVGVEVALDVEAAEELCVDSDSREAAGSSVGDSCDGAWVSASFAVLPAEDDDPLEASGARAGGFSECVVDLAGLV